ALFSVIYLPVHCRFLVCPGLPGTALSCGRSVRHGSALWHEVCDALCLLLSDRRWRGSVRCSSPWAGSDGNRCGDGVQPGDCAGRESPHAPGSTVRSLGSSWPAPPRSCCDPAVVEKPGQAWILLDRKSTRLNSSHVNISYAVFC